MGESQLLYVICFAQIFQEFEEGDENGATDSALLEDDNDFEDFWANPTFKDKVEKKQLEIRLTIISLNLYSVERKV